MDINASFTSIEGTWSGSLVDGPKLKKKKIPQLLSVVYASIHFVHDCLCDGKIFRFIIFLHAIEVHDW